MEKVSVVLANGSVQTFTASGWQWIAAGPMPVLQLLSVVPTDGQAPEPDTIVAAFSGAAVSSVYDPTKLVSQ